MKIIGFVLITLGLVLLLFVIYNFLNQNNRMVSPIPENNGVKVIFVTPTK